MFLCITKTKWIEKKKQKIKSEGPKSRSMNRKLKFDYKVLKILQLMQSKNI